MMWQILHEVREWLHQQYESRKLYVANPCDADAHKWLKPLGYALSLLSVACPCCSAVRILIALLVGAFAPKAVTFAILIAVATLVAVVYLQLARDERGHH